MDIGYLTLVISRFKRLGYTRVIAVFKDPDPCEA